MALWTGWKSKPPQGTPLDPTNGFTQGLACVLPFNDPYGSPHATFGGLYAAPDVGVIGSPTWGSGQDTVAYNTPSGASLEWSCEPAGDAISIQNLAAFTVLWIGTINSSSRADFLNQWGSGVGDRWLLTANTASPGVFTAYTNSSGVNGTSTGSFTTGKRYAVAATYGPGSSGGTSIYLNGVFQSSQTEGVDNTSSNKFIVGQSGDATTGSSSHSLILIWDYVMSAAQIAAISGDPWQIFASPIPWWLEPAGAAASTFHPWIYGDQIQEMYG